MRRYILYILGLFALVCISCGDDSKGLLSTGTLYLNVEEDETLLTKVQTEVSTESLRVDILRQEGDTIQTYEDYLTEVKGQELLLPAGIYTVVVRSNHEGEAGWETPLYEGKEEVEIKKGEISNVKVICKIANAKVSVVYGDALREQFSDYQATVSNESGSLKYTKDEPRSGFFTPEKLKVVLDLVNHEDNSFCLRQVYPDIKAQYHYTFRFDLSNSGSEGEAGGDFNVSVDDTHREISYTILISQEDLSSIKEPLAHLNGSFTADGIYSYRIGTEMVEGQKIGLTYQLGEKCELSSAIITTTSPTLIGAGLIRFNLMEPTDMERAKAFGFSELPSVASTSDGIYKTFDWNLTSVVKYLESKDMKPTDHVFTVSLVDDRYQEVTVNFTIKIIPDVAASVDHPLCWTRFAVLRGICQDETAYFKLTGDDGTEKEIRNVSYDGNGNITALVTGLTEEKVTYSYCLVSDNDPGMKCEPVSFKLDPPTYIPNMGFEEWGSRSGTVTDVPVLGSMNVTYVSPNLDGNAVYWDSGNMGSAAAGATLTNQTDEVAVSSSGKAAKLSSLYASKLGMGAFAAGSVYAGQAKSVSAKGAVLQYGRSYQGYPTHFRGYYKYTPGVIDYYGGLTPEGGLKSGDSDECFIYVALCTKSIEVVSLTSRVTPFSKDNPAVFAYGEYIAKATDTALALNGYAPFDIRLDYRTDVPKDGSFYIVIVASASRYGDYFTGSTKSVLYVDEFSLGYDYDAASFSGTGLKNMTPVNIKE